MKTIRSAGARILFTSDATELRAAVVEAVAAGINLEGADLVGANLRDAYLRNADLARADLRGADMRGANLRGARLEGADLAEAYLEGANLRGADLRDADLRDANLEGADLRGAVLGDIPIVHRLHQQILAAIEAGGRLEMSDWHTCETTHCRAGWAVHLAGPAGYELEERLGPEIAGALITVASCHWLERSPNFYANNGDAIANISQCAEREV